jgi:uncharacterized protein (TIGR03086 family)
MSGPLDLWRQAAAKWSEVYGQVTDSEWDRPTPCDEWTVRQLVEHTLGWQAEGGRLIGADTAPGDDWNRIRAAFDALLSEPSRLTGSVAEFGGIPKQELAGFLIGDLLLHSWDLARSIGADEALPPDAVEATTIGLHHVPPALLRGTNPLGQKMMAEAVEVPADAGPQDKMLAFTGRRPLGTNPGRSRAAPAGSGRRDRPGLPSVKRSPPGVPGGRCSRGSRPP